MIFVHLNPSISNPQIKLIEKSLRVAEKLNATHYVMHGGNIPLPYFTIERPKDRNHFLDLFSYAFKSIFQKAYNAGVKVVLENLYGNRIFGNVEDFIKIKENIPEIGFCFDVGHAEITQITEEIFRRLEIDHVHITDNDLIKDRHMVVGEGKIDFKKIFTRLKDKKYDGKVIVENLSFEECVESVKRIKEFLS